MGTRDPFKLYDLPRSSGTMSKALSRGGRRSPTDVTQGGSSRKNRGAKPAAVNGSRPAVHFGAKAGLDTSSTGEN